MFGRNAASTSAPMKAMLISASTIRRSRLPTATVTSGAAAAADEPRNG